MDLPAVHTFVLQILEISDWQSAAVAQAYALAKLNQLREAVDLQATPHGTSSKDQQEAKAFPGTFLTTLDEPLLQALATATPARGSRPPADTPTKPDKPDDGVRRQICFEHHPASNGTCKTRGCTRVHLDTTKPSELDRYNKAKASFDDANSRKAKRKSPTST
jgi:hypothetical protein